MISIYPVSRANYGPFCYFYPDRQKALLPTASYAYFLRERYSTIDCHQRPSNGSYQIDIRSNITQTFVHLSQRPHHDKTMSSTNSNDTTKLAATALVAGGLGALVSYYLSQRQRPSPSPRNALPPATRTSFIFHDAANDPAPATSDAAVLFPHSHEERMRRRIAARMSIEEENSQPRRSVTVRVPATSANCGPGFDCIGLAVDLWTEVTVSRADKFEITAEGEGAEDMPKDETNYIVTGVKAAYDTAEKPMPPLKYHIVSRIPYARGLGSSSAAIVAGIIAGLVLAGHRLPVWGSESLLQIAASIEGHPDNVAPVSGSTCLFFRSEISHASSFHLFLTPRISFYERSFTEDFKSESTTEHDGSQNVYPPHPVFNWSCSFLIS